MKVTNRQLLNAAQTLIKIFNYPQEDFKKAYAMSRRSEKINKELTHLNSANNAIIRKFGLKKEGQLVTTEKGIEINDPEKYEIEFNQFADTEIEIDIWPIPFFQIEEMKETDTTKDETTKTKSNRPFLNPYEISLIIPFMSELPDDTAE